MSVQVRDYLNLCVVAGDEKAREKLEAQVALVQKFAMEGGELAREAVLEWTIPEFNEAVRLSGEKIKEAMRGLEAPKLAH